MRGLHQFFGGGVQNDRKTVVRNVPHELLPANDGEIVEQLRGYPGPLKIVGDGPHAVTNPARRVFAEPDPTVVKMADVAGTEFVGTQETQSTHDALRSDNFGDLRLDT